MNLLDRQRLTLMGLLCSQRLAFMANFGIRNCRLNEAINFCLSCCSIRR